MRCPALIFLIPISGENQKVNEGNLNLWTSWASLHWIVLLISYYQNGSQMLDFAFLSLVRNQYMADFQQLLKVFKRNAADFGINFIFSENTFFTFPIEGQKRWWVEAKVTIVDKFKGFWQSEEHSIAQICLTKGHPRSLEYFRGLIQHPDFLEAWSCQSFNFCKISYQLKCVRCNFIELISDQLQRKFDEIFCIDISQFLTGLSQFKLI